MKHGIIYQVEEKSPSDPNSPKPSKKNKWLCCIRACQFFQLVSSKNNDKPTYDVEMESPKCQTIPSSETKKSLILDLDETLVHSSFKPEDPHDFKVDIQVQGFDFTIYVSVRPGAETFIEELSKFYDVIFYTASLREYADPVMDRLDKNKVATKRLFREHCLILNNSLVKDLRQIRKDLRNAIIVDNSELSFRLQPENAYHIRDYFNDKQDNDLAQLQDFLIWLNEADDVRPVWKMKQVYEKNMKQVALTTIRQSTMGYEQQFQEHEEIQKQSIKGRTILQRENSSKPLIPENSSKQTTPGDEVPNKSNQKSQRKIHALQFGVEDEMTPAQKINSPTSHPSQYQRYSPNITKKD